MKLALRSTAAGAVGLLAAATITLVGGAAAHATAVTPPWTTDPLNVGSIAFYDASGARVTSGSVADTPFTYAVGSHAGRVGDSTATLYIAVPSSGTSPSAWANEQYYVGTDYPDADAPTPLNTSAQPLVKLDDVNENKLDNYLGDLPNTSTGAYANLWELRIKTSGNGQPSDGSYDATDILVTGTGDTATWSEVTETTATAVAVGPSTHAAHGADVALSATVSPVGAAGTVQFSDGGVSVGSPVTVSDGTATAPVNDTFAVGAHSFSAAFTPTDTSAWAGSTSPDAAYTIDSGAAATTTTLSTSPGSSTDHGTKVTLKGTVTPSNAAGSIAFLDGSKVLKTVAVTSGSATYATTSLSDATHKLSARFVPTSSSAFTSSTSSVKSYVVRAHSTKTTLSASPKSVKKGKKVTLTATVSPTAAGKIRFYDGKKLLATVTVSKGKATYKTTKLAVGSHGITARFVPKSSADDSASTSKKTTVKVKK